jgi:hypothetical protein
VSEADRRESACRGRLHLLRVRSEAGGVALGHFEIVIGAGVQAIDRDSDRELGVQPPAPPQEPAVWTDNSDPTTGVVASLPAEVP